MTPFFSIITPTIQRESLVRCCDSVDSQSFRNWEHIVAIDAPLLNLPLLSKCDNSAGKRLWLTLGAHYSNWGNTPRHKAWNFCGGTYLLYLDCDNYLANPDALAEIASYLIAAEYPSWALFPIHRHGSIFLLDPPGLCRTDTANIVVKREIGQWPDIPEREADGYFTEHLLAHHPYRSFPRCQPIITMEKSSGGV